MSNKFSSNIISFSSYLYVAPNRTPIQRVKFFSAKPEKVTAFVSVSLQAYVNMSSASRSRRQVCFDMPAPPKRFPTLRLLSAINKLSLDNKISSPLLLIRNNNSHTSTSRGSKSPFKFDLCFLSFIYSFSVAFISLT